MRLLLDEHYPIDIAANLRDLGHDAICVSERSDVSGLPDDALLSVAISDKRAIVTENVRDFQPLAGDRIIQGGSHYGMIFSSPSSLPSTRRRIGAFVKRLAALMQAHPADDGFLNRFHWLS